MEVVKLIKKPIGKTKVEFYVTVSGETTSEAIDYALGLIARTTYTVIPDDGDAEKILREKMGDQQFEIFLKNHTMGRLSPFILNDEEGLNMAFEPECTSDEMPRRGEPFTFTIHVLLKPKYELTSYEPVSVVVPRYRVPEAAVDAQIEQLASMNITYKKIDDKGEPAQLGQHITIDMRVTREGEEVRGLCGEGRLLELSYDYMPKDFIDHIVGMRVGETREFEFQGPREDAQTIDDTEAYEAVITVKDFQRQLAPQITNAWVEVNLPDAGNVEGLRAQIRKSLEQQTEQQAQQDLGTLVDAELAKRFSGSVNDEIYEAAGRNIYQSMVATLRQQGKTLEDMMKEQNMTEDQVNMQIMLQARDIIRQGFSLDKLFEVKVGELTDDDIEQAYHAFAPGHEEEAKQQFAESGRFYAVREVARRLAAHRWLLDTANVEYREFDMPAAPNQGN